MIIINNSAIWKVIISKYVFIITNKYHLIPSKRSNQIKLHHSIIIHSKISLKAKQLPPHQRKKKKWNFNHQRKSLKSAPNKRRKRERRRRGCPLTPISRRPRGAERKSIRRRRRQSTATRRRITCQRHTHTHTHTSAERLSCVECDNLMGPSSAARPASLAGPSVVLAWSGGQEVVSSDCHP